MRIINKTALSRFAIEEKCEAGIELLGSEVKAIRLGHMDITSSYVKIISGQAYLVNGKIFPYKFSRIEGYQEDRTRRLLLHKKELLTLKNKLETGKYTLVPLSLYLKHGIFKVEVGLAKGKKDYEKDKDSKRRAIERARSREEKNVF